MRDTRPCGGRPGAATTPPVGIIYLCCDDADWSALESLTRLSYPGPLRLIIHDDSRDGDARVAVDRMAKRLSQLREWEVQILRRPHRTGGKPAAVNYALEQSAQLYEYFLLCDNDSTVLDPDTIQRALSYLELSTLGGVQFRSVPVADPGYCRANERLAESIGAFHAFLAPAARFGWMPFIGHNALLNTRAVQQVGGLTPDFFSDDLDLTVRLNLAGFRIAYAPEIAMGENTLRAIPRSGSVATNGRMAACKRCGRIRGPSWCRTGSRWRRSSRFSSSPGSIASKQCCSPTCASCCSSSRSMGSKRLCRLWFRV
jgi:cellulose synthase/poly-beta-1,6-N-acetylglucosamine synthase-like glycosyltransferase